MGREGGGNQEADRDSCWFCALFRSSPPLQFVRAIEQAKSPRIRDIPGEDTKVLFGGEDLCSARKREARGHYWIV